MTPASALDTAPRAGLRASLPPYRTAWPRILIVMAHPDDEHALAATTYRITRELAGMADHVVITNGEGGYRYASLALAVYGVSIAREPDGRANLPAIRRRETVNAGRILGISGSYESLRCHRRGANPAVSVSMTLRPGSRFSRSPAFCT
jgi:LmbE family N-acetylglucosaminyl deacetylase